MEHLVETLVRPFPATASRRRVMVAFAALLLLVAGLGPLRPAHAATTYYVSTAGSDSNPGSLASPWRTLNKALRSLTAGDTLLVRGGTYVERITSVIYQPGTANNPIRVAAYPGERPLVKGVLQIRGANYWTFDGINATWDPATGAAGDMLVKIMHGVGWTFRNAEISGARTYAGLYIGSGVVGEPRDWRVTGNCIHDTYATHEPFQDHNIYVGLKPEDQPGAGVISRNILYNASNGDNIKVGGGGEGGAEDVQIYNNTLYNASQNARILGATARTTVQRNLMSKATGKWWYPNLRGQSVTGAGNIAYDNAGFAAERFLKSTNSTRPIVDGGGNVFGIDPKFGPLGCGGFKPQNAALKMFGRWSPSGDPVAGDWDGDGADSPGFVRGNVWHLGNDFPSQPDHVFAFGRVTDIPVVGDWDGDGDDTPGLVRGNTWFLDNGFDGVPEVSFGYARTTDRPVVGDWDADGDDTPGVVRGNVWYLNNATDPNADMAFAFGKTTDMAIAGDWDGDGDDTPGLVRANSWYLNDAFGAYANISFAYGSLTDAQVVGDWDGDGATTVGMVRATSWFLSNDNAAGPHEILFSDENWG